MQLSRMTVDVVLNCDRATLFFMRGGERYRDAGAGNRPDALMNYKSCYLLYGVNELFASE